MTQTIILENLFGFLPKQSTLKVIFLLKSLIEQYWEAYKDFYMIFYWPRKAYDKGP